MTAYQGGEFLGWRCGGSIYLLTRLPFPQLLPSSAWVRLFAMFLNYGTINSTPIGIYSDIISSPRKSALGQPMRPSQHFHDPTLERYGLGPGLMATPGQTTLGTEPSCLSTLCPIAFSLDVFAAVCFCQSIRIAQVTSAFLFQEADGLRGLQEPNSILKVFTDFQCFKYCVLFIFSLNIFFIPSCLPHFRPTFLPFSSSPLQD